MMNTKEEIEALDARNTFEQLNIKNQHKYMHIITMKNLRLIDVLLIGMCIIIFIVILYISYEMGYVSGVQDGYIVASYICDTPVEYMGA